MLDIRGDHRQHKGLEIAATAKIRYWPLLPIFDEKGPAEDLKRDHVDFTALPYANQMG